jgi:hypothetical protein
MTDAVVDKSLVIVGVTTVVDGLLVVVVEVDV